MSDTNILIEDGAMDLTFGKVCVTVRALNIESSVQWSKRVKRVLFEQAQREQRAGVSAALATDAEKVEALLTSDEFNASGDGWIVIRDLLMEHSPGTMTLEVLNGGTVTQIVNAFREVFKTENPTLLLKQALQGV